MENPREHCPELISTYSLKILLTISKLLRIHVYISFYGMDHNRTALILQDFVYNINVVLVNVLFENREVSNVCANFKRYNYIILKTQGWDESTHEASSLE